MPSTTITADSNDATRIIATLADTPYPQTANGVKALLIDYLKSRVAEFERNRAITDAVTAVETTSEINIT